MSDYTDYFRAPGAGASYDAENYALNGFDAHTGALELDWVRAQITRRFPSTPPVHLDFACGTGRALEALSPVVGEAHGYDTSPQMLDEARTKGVAADLHEISADGPLPERPSFGDRPVLVTAFRFLLNAEDGARDRALAFAAAALQEAPCGLVVVNNHGNRSSARELARWRRRRGPWFNSLRHGQVLDLLTRHGLRPIAWHGFGLLPPSLYRHAWTAAMARRANSAAARHRLLSRVSIDVVYLAGRPCPG